MRFIVKSLFLLAVLFCLSSLATAGIVEKFNQTDLSITNYVLVDSVLLGSTLNNSYQLEVINTSESDLINVQLTLIHVDNDAEIIFSILDVGSVGPNQTLVTTNMIEISVGVDQTEVVNYTWQIEYDIINGDHILDEAMVEFNY